MIILKINWSVRNVGLRPIRHIDPSLGWSSLTLIPGTCNFFMKSDYFEKKFELQLLKHLGEYSTSLPSVSNENSGVTQVIRLVKSGQQDTHQQGCPPPSCKVSPSPFVYIMIDV